MVHHAPRRQLQKELGQAKRAAEVQGEPLTAQLQQFCDQLQAQAEQQVKAKQAQLEAQLQQITVHITKQLAQSRAQLSKAEAAMRKANSDRLNVEVKLSVHQLKAEGDLKLAKALLAQKSRQLQQAEDRERELLRVQQELRARLAAQEPSAVATQLEQTAAQLAESQRQLQRAEARLDDVACAICLTAPRSASLLPCMHR